MALVEIAGGKISAYEGDRFDIGSGRVLACAPGLHQAMVNELGQVQPLSGTCFGAPGITAMGS